VKSSKGLTLVELVVVLAIIGIFMAMGMGPVMGWLSHYRFQAMGRALINATQSARMQAISGLPALPVRPTTSIQSAGGGTTFRVFLDAYTVTCDTCTGDNGAPTKAELPITAGDYATVTGFNQPDYLNGVLFQVGAGPDPTISSTPTTDAWGHKKWSVSAGHQLDLVPVPGSGIVWTDTTTTFSTTTGKVHGVACLKFTQQTWGNKTGVAYTVTKSKTGSSVEFYFDANLVDVQVNGASSGWIVFDFAGATLNHQRYTVSITKMRKKAGYALEADTRTPALVFQVDPSGRIKLGL